MQSLSPWRPPDQAPLQRVAAGLPAEACRVPTTIWEGHENNVLPFPNWSSGLCKLQRADLQPLFGMGLNEVAAKVRGSAAACI